MTHTYTSRSTGKCGASGDVRTPQQRSLDIEVGVHLPTARGEKQNSHPTPTVRELNSSDTHTHTHSQKATQARRVHKHDLQERCRNKQCKNNVKSKQQRRTMPNRNKQCKNNVESKQRKNNVDLRQTIVHSTKRAMDQRLGRRCAGSLNLGDQNSDGINATYDGQPLCGAGQHDLFAAPAQSFAHARAFRTSFPVRLFVCLFASSSSSASSVVFMRRAARRASCYVFLEACLSIV